MKYLCILYSLLIPFFGITQTIGITSFATSFASPIEITHPAGDSRLFVVQQGGAIKILKSDGTTNAVNFLTLTPNTISSGGEKGLLGLAFHPNYATNGYFYVNYTNIFGNTVIARYSVNPINPDIANTTGTIFLTITQPYENHNGGTLKFGPDGYLYIGMGDGGSSGDPQNRAQNINENLGKMLRIDVDSASPYGIPPTNPYVEKDGNDEIWAIGLRNPWKFSFDRLNGDLWIADVGQNQVEEINKIISPLPVGLNFGWNCYEGNNVYKTNCALPNVTYTFPFAQYTHGSGACSITGGYVYTGNMYPNFTSKYFFADFCLNRIGTVNSAGEISYSETFSGSNKFTTFGEDLNGELYVAASNGTIYKIVDTSLRVNTFNNNDFTLFPNPAQNLVTITSSVSISNPKIEIYDLLGRMINQFEIKSQKEAILLNVESLEIGIYILILKENNKVIMQKKLQIL